MCGFLWRYKLTEASGVCQVCKRPVVCTEEPRSQKTPSVSVASMAGQEDICEETSPHADNHSGTALRMSLNLVSVHIQRSTLYHVFPCKDFLVPITPAISSLSSDPSPVLSSTIRASIVSPTGRSSPAKFPAVSERAPPQQPSSSRTRPTEPTKPLVLTHLVDGFIIQEGLEPFPVRYGQTFQDKMPSWNILKFRKWHRNCKETVADHFSLIKVVLCVQIDGTIYDGNKLL